MSDRRRSLSAAPRPLGALLVAATALTLIACGSSGSTSGGETSAVTQPATTTGQSSGDAADRTAQAQQRLEALYNGESFGTPPSSSPPPKAGIKVTLVDIGLSVPGGAEFADAVERAAKQFDWDLHVYDAQLNPSKFQDGIRQAIANGSQAIILFDINCPQAQQALEEARKAKITVVAAESVDCDESSPPGPKLFSAELQYAAGGWPDFTHDVGAAQADYVIAKTDGKAKVVLLEQTDLETATFIQDGFKEELATCEGCEIVDTVKLTFADLGPKLQEKVQQALLQHPDANALVAPYDDLMTGGAAAAVVQAGRANDLISLAGAGFKPSVDLVRNGQGQTAGYIVSVPWEGYAAVDTLNRVLNGEEPESSGIGISFFDKEHNLPDSGSAKSPVDFAAAYEKAWSAAQ